MHTVVLIHGLWLTPRSWHDFHKDDRALDWANRHLGAPAKVHEHAMGSSR
jgi:hypothetical protein